MKFDIVTPSYNQCRYLQETLESVRFQKSDEVEVAHYVLDGGSTDGSRELIKSCESFLTFWKSEKDDGQSAAIAQGLSMGDGDIVTWINSDDYFPPGVFKKVSDYFQQHPDVDAVYGDCLMVNKDSQPVGLGTHIPVAWEDLFETPYLINQESTFVRRRLYEKVGGVDPSYWGAMDYDLWLRVFREGNVVYLPEILGIHRFLPNQKSSTSDRYIREMKAAREKFGRHYDLEVPPWPYSEDGIERIRSKWEEHWMPVLKWAENGCAEVEFESTVRETWKRYSQSGVLAVQGTTSFGWIGPDCLYILDRTIVGPEIEWVFASPSTGLSAKTITLNIDGIRTYLTVDEAVSQKFLLNKDKRFSVVRITADKEFIPALENWGPAYFSLSLVAAPRPQGKQILSVQSIPCYPSADSFKQESEGNARQCQPGTTASEQETMKKKPAATGGRRRRPLRVAFFTAYPANIGSGSEKLIYETVKTLIARGHDARVFVMNFGLDKTPPFFSAHMPVFPLEQKIEHIFRQLTGLNDILFPSTALLGFTPWIRSSDILHFHNLHAHYLSIPILGLLSRKKRVVVSPVDQYLTTGYCPYALNCERYMTGCGECPRVNDSYPGISRDSTRLLYRMKRLALRFSRFNMFFHTRYLASHYEKALGRSMPIIYYGVDVNCFKPILRSVCAERLGIRLKTSFVVGLFHSHINEPRKGIVPIIEKLNDMAGKLSDKLELLVVGHGSEAVRGLVHRDIAVTALPFFRHAHELACALNLCDVLLYPTQAENMSLTTLSALACGVPVISYDVGGQGEAVVNGHNGFLIPQNDYDGLAASLEMMIRDPGLCRQLSEGARTTALQTFDFERYIDELIDYYYKIMQN